MTYFVAGLIAPFVIALLLAVPLWIIRRLFPSAEPYFYGPISNVGYLIGRIAGQTLRAIRRLVV
jgi:hypothetical protein